MTNIRNCVNNEVPDELIDNKVKKRLTPLPSSYSPRSRTSFKMYTPVKRMSPSTSYVLSRKSLSPTAVTSNHTIRKSLSPATVTPHHSIRPSIATPYSEKIPISNSARMVRKAYLNTPDAKCSRKSSESDF